MPFQLESTYTPSGDQPTAIQALTDGVLEGERYHTLISLSLFFAENLTLV